jgi:hypothetical protein
MYYVFQNWHALKHNTQLLDAGFTRKAFFELKTRVFWKDREGNFSLCQRIGPNNFMWASYKIILPYNFFTVELNFLMSEVVSLLDEYSRWVNKVIVSENG